MARVKKQRMVNVSASDADAFDRLSPKMQLFVHEYVQDFNASRAAKEAGYSSSGQIGASLLNKPAIQKALRHLMKPILKQAKITQENTWQQAYNFLFYDIAQYYDEDGNLTCAIQDLPPELRQCITGVEVTPHYDREGNLLKRTTRLRLVEKTSVLNLVMKALQLVKEEHKHTFSIEMLYKEAAEPITVEAVLNQLLVTDVKNGK